MRHLEGSCDTSNKPCIISRYAASSGIGESVLIMLTSRGPSPRPLHAARTSRSRSPSTAGPRTMRDSDLRTASLMSSLSESLPDLQSCSSHDDEKCLCQELGSLCLDGTSDTCDDIPEHPSFMCRCDSPHSNQENQQPTDCCSTEFSTVTDSDIISISRNHQRLVDVHVVCPLQLTLQLDAEARKCTCYAQPTESTDLMTQTRAQILAKPTR